MAAGHTAYMTTRRFTAGAAIAKDTLVYLKSDGKVYNIADQTKPPLGTTTTASTASGDSIEVGLHGVPRKCLAGGTVTVGSLLQATTGGKIVDATTNNDNWIIGVALETVASGEKGEYMPLHSADTDTVANVDAD